MKNKRLFAILFIGLFLVSSVAYAAWSTTTKATDNKVDDLLPKVAIENDVLHMLYILRDKYMNDHYYYKKKSVNKDGWSSRVSVPIPEPNSGESLAAYDGKAYVAYSAWDKGYDDEIYFTTNKSGAWLKKPIKITNNSKRDSWPQLAQDNGKFYIVFVREVSPYTYDIYFTKNTAGIWTTPKALTSDDTNDSFPYVAAKNGKIIVAWTSHLKNYMNGGPSIRARIFSKGKWSSVKTVISESEHFGYDVGNVFLYKDTIPVICYKKAENAISFSVGYAYLSSGKWLKKDITNNSGPFSDTWKNDSYPKMLSFNNKLKIIWWRDFFDKSDYQTHYDFWFGRANSLTSSWSKSNITNTKKIEEAWPDFAIDSIGRSHVVYNAYDNDGDDEVFYKKEL